MPAPTATDVARATRAAAIDVQSSSSVLSRQAGARANLETPRPGFFDSASDAATVNAAAFSLIGTERRRFAVLLQSVLDLDPSQATPAVTLIDTTLAANGAFLVARIEIDDAAETTGLELFG